MEQRNTEKKKLNLGKLIGLLVVLALAETELFAALLTIALALSPIALAIWLIRRASRQKSRTQQPPVRREPAFDECPQGFFCFHRDKGEHHVRRGKEIDPWDRPDIDISKYQRK